MVDLVIPDSVAEVVALPKVNNAVPGVFHPANIDYENHGNNSALKAASDALKAIYEEAGAINELRGNPHEEARAATHDRTVREKVEAAERALDSRLGGAMFGLRAEFRRIEAELDEKAGFVANPAHFSAIVGTLQGMTPEARVGAIGEMVEAGDNATLATIAEAPLFLTGIPKEVRDTIKTRVLQKVAPAGVNLRNALIKAMGHVEAAGNASVFMYAALRGGAEPGAWRERAKQAWARNMAANAGVRR